MIPLPVAKSFGFTYQYCLADFAAEYGVVNNELELLYVIAEFELGKKGRDIISKAGINLVDFCRKSTNKRAAERKSHKTQIAIEVSDDETVTSKKNEPINIHYKLETQLAAKSKELCQLKTENEKLLSRNSELEKKLCETEKQALLSKGTIERLRTREREQLNKLKDYETTIKSKNNVANTALSEAAYLKKSYGVQLEALAAFVRENDLVKLEIETSKKRK